MSLVLSGGTLSYFWRHDELSLSSTLKSSVFPDDSGTLAEELLYDSIVELVASVLPTYFVKLNWMFRICSTTYDT